MTLQEDKGEGGGGGGSTSYYTANEAIKESAKEPAWNKLRVLIRTACYTAQVVLTLTSKTVLNSNTATE